MAREAALCALPPMDASCSNIAAMTARRLFMRMCSSSLLPDQAMTVGLRCGAVGPLNTFSDDEVAVDLSCGKANNIIPTFFARLDPGFARDNSGRSVLFSTKEESTRLATSCPFSMKQNGKEPAREKTLLLLARVPLQKMPTWFTAPFSQEEDLTLRDGPVMTPQFPA